MWGCCLYRMAAVAAVAAEKCTAVAAPAVHPEQLADIWCQTHQEIMALAEMNQHAIPFDSACIPFEERPQFKLHSQNQQV